jgi:hypothetical protein
MDMDDRKPFIYAGALLTAVVLAVGVLWFRSQEAPTSPISVSLDGTLFGASGPAEQARTPIPLDQTEAVPITVYLTPTCGCCAGWVEHLAQHGFEPELRYMTDAELGALKGELGIRPELASCHSAVVNGYLVEGHVPAEVIRQMLAEAPPALGVTAPGMPVGSPGMEVEGIVQPYDVLLLTADGRSQVYSKQGRN